MSCFTNSIKDSRLIAYIFHFAPSSSLPCVNRFFRSLVDTELCPLLAKKCMNFVRQNKSALGVLLTHNVFSKGATSLNLKTIHKVMKAFSIANGDRVKMEGMLDPIASLQKISQEDDLSLVDFFKAFSESIEFPKPKTVLKNAEEIRLWMNEHKESFKEIRCLDLSHKQLKSIPSEIEYFENLIILNVSNNRIKHISSAIGKLSSLREFAASNNLLYYLPQGFSRLNNLRVLTLHNNKFTLFPEEILSFLLLKKLNLAFNKIAALPINNNDLPVLDQLDVSYNPLPQEYVIPLRGRAHLYVEYEETSCL